MGSDGAAVKQEQLLDLVDFVYGIAADRASLPDFLEHLTAAFDGRSAAFFIRHAGDLAPVEAHVHNVPDREMARYNAYYWHVDERRHRAERHPCLTVSDAMVIAPMEEERSEIYTDFYRPNGLDRLIATRTRPDAQGLTAGLSVMRPRSDGPFSPDALRALDLLGRHFQRAASLMMRLDRLAVERDALMNCIDRFAQGIVLLDRYGKPVAANREALRLLKIGDGLSDGPEGLRARRDDENSRLSAAVQGAITVGLGLDLPMVVADGLMVSRAIGPPLQVRVLPLPPRARQRFEGGASAGPVALVFISDRGIAAEMEPDLLRAMFALTATEAEVARFLGSGHSPEAIAAIHCVSINTVRTQIRAIMEKTGCSRATDLVALLSGGLPGHTRDPEGAP